MKLFLFEIRDDYASGDPEDALNRTGILQAENEAEAEKIVAAYVLELGIECEVGEEVKFHLSEVKPAKESGILATTYPSDSWCPGVEIGGEVDAEEDREQRDLHEP